MHVVYYVTSHGYGHAVRTAAICNALSSTVRLTIRTTVPERFWREEIERPFSYAPAAFDCGCLQHDSLTIDAAATAARYRALAGDNRRRLDAEATWLRTIGANAVASDIVPFAFDAAAQAGIPSVATTNFTWLDVYRISLMGIPGIEPLLDEMHNQYAMADLLLALAPALPMPYFRRREEVAPTGRCGRVRRDEIVTRYGLDPGKKIALVYFGEFGLQGIPWKKLEAFERWIFIGVCPLDPQPSNYRLIPKTDFRYQDLAASADLMIAKLGYCVTSECMINRIPLLYVPRDDFAESPALENGIVTWGGGFRIVPENFRKLAWGPLLDRIASTGKPGIVARDGANHCARAIERLAAMS